MQLCTDQKISVSEARKNLPLILEEVYLRDKNYVITKRGIPMVSMTKNMISKKKKNMASDRKKAFKLAKSLKGVWSEEWKTKSSLEVARLLRKRAEIAHAS